MRGERINVGDRVLCRYFNKPENKFYGPRWLGIIVAVNKDIPDNRDYTVKKDSGPTVTLWHKEIKKVLRVA